MAAPTTPTPKATPERIPLRERLAPHRESVLRSVERLRALAAEERRRTR